MTTVSSMTWPPTDATRSSPTRRPASSPNARSSIRRWPICAQATCSSSPGCPVRCGRWSTCSRSRTSCASAAST